MQAHASYLAHVKRQNRSAILALLKANDALSVADVARATGLSVATCATALSDMADSGEVVVMEEKIKRGGRPARRFAFNPDNILVAALFLGVSRKKERLRFSIANAHGERIDSGGEEKAAVTLPDIENLIAGLSRRHPNVRAVALSVPGVVKDGCVDFCDIPALEGVRLAERIRSACGLETVADNDINFAALGFLETIAHKDRPSLVYMSFPEQMHMGAGVIVNGSLVRGRTSFAGELSFIPFDKAKKGCDRVLPKPERFVDYAAKLSVAVTAVIDPDTIVLEGHAITPEVRDAVRNACLKHIPAKHVPDFVMRSDSNADALAGMVAAAVKACLRANKEEIFKENHHEA